MNGKSANQFNFLREKLLKILSHAEAKIDFPDEDLPNDILKDIKKSSEEVIKKIELISRFSIHNFYSLLSLNFGFRRN